MTALFLELTPDRVLDAIETAGVRATGYCFQLNSLENRVYEVELEGEERRVLKFYRPGRWALETILEEHAFLTELGRAEVPAVAPLDLGGGETVREVEGIYWAAFPKVRGRVPDELDDDRLAWIGRLLARMHTVGAARPAQHRRRLDPETFGAQSLAALAATQWIPMEVASRYRAAAEAVIERARALYRGLPLFRIHGDCHPANLLWNQTGPFFLDFDDMVIGPAAQDLWLLVPGRDEDAHRRRQKILEGYREMRDLDGETLLLVEPLRGLRILHYSAWIASHWPDPAFPRAFPDFPSHMYWARETDELERVVAMSAGV